MPSFVGDVIGGVADAVGGAVGGIADAVGSVADAVDLGTLGTIASFATGNPLFAVAGNVGEGDVLGAFTSAFNPAGNLFGDMGGVASILPGEIGGLPTEGLGAFGTLANLVKAGTTIYSAFNQPGTQSPTSAQNRTDPYAQYRADAATQLNQLMKNPAMVYGMPGYNFAQQQGANQILRSAAATGNLGSGNTAASLRRQGAETAQSWFNDYVNKLATYSGASQSPAAGANAYTAAETAQNQADKAKQMAILQGISGIASSGFFS